MVPKLAPLQRTVTEHLQVARQGAGEQFKKTELGRTLSLGAYGLLLVRCHLAPTAVHPCRVHPYL
jgi:hypothetical protein